jgi:hypothetical protein
MSETIGVNKKYVHNMMIFFTVEVKTYDNTHACMQTHVLPPSPSSF